MVQLTHIDRYRMGMFAGRRFALIGMVATVAWYVCVVLLWAIQPLNDSVPVGVDNTLTPAKLVSVSVDCNGLFDSAPRDGSPLPALKAQPQGKPKLAFQREPCGVVHTHARVVFAIDTAAFVGVVALFVWLAIRRRRSAQPPIDIDSSPSLQPLPTH